MNNIHSKILVIAVLSAVVISMLAINGAAFTSNANSGSGSNTPIMASNGQIHPFDIQQSVRYYVSTSGNNSNSGLSLSQAFGNISHAVSAVPSGSTIIVAPGTYVTSQPIIITKALTIRSFSGNYISSHVYLTAVPSEINLNGRASAYFQLGGSSAPNTYAGSPVTNVTIMGFNFHGAGIQVPGTGGAYLNIVDNSFTNMYVEPIGYHANPLGTTEPFSYKFPLDNFINVSGNYINNVSTSNLYYASGIWLGNLQNSTISNNVVMNTDYAGIILTGSNQGNEGNNLVYGNIVRDVQQEGIQIAFGFNVRVIDNTVISAGMGGTTVGKDAGIAIFNPNQENIIMTGNTLKYSYEGLGISQANTPFTDLSLGEGFVFFQNNIIGNGIGVANNAGTGMLNASNNYWGLHFLPALNGFNGYSGNVSVLPVSHHPFVNQREFGFGMIFSGLFSFPSRSLESFIFR